MTAPLTERAAELLEEIRDLHQYKPVLLRDYMEASDRANAFLKQVQKMNLEQKKTGCLELTPLISASEKAHETYEELVEFIAQDMDEYLIDQQGCLPVLAEALYTTENEQEDYMRKVTRAYAAALQGRVVTQEELKRADD